MGAESARETSEEAVAADVPDARASAGLSPAAPLSARSLLSLQRHAGNRATAGLVRRLQRAGGTLKPEKVQEVYGYWLMELGKARSVNVADASIDAAARAKVKTQVGDANFSGVGALGARDRREGGRGGGTRPPRRRSTPRGSCARATPRCGRRPRRCGPRWSRPSTWRRRSTSAPA